MSSSWAISQDVKIVRGGCSFKKMLEASVDLLDDLQRFKDETKTPYAWRCMVSDAIIGKLVRIENELVCFTNECKSNSTFDLEQVEYFFNVLEHLDHVYVNVMHIIPRNELVYTLLSKVKHRVKQFLQ